MPSPVVRTKLFIPHQRPGLVARDRLTARLVGAAHTRLTLVAAPAGFGKTTLLTSWLAAGSRAGRSVAWVSLDEGERDAREFWTYVLTAVETASPGTGAEALRLLEAGRTPIESVLGVALNEVASVSAGLDLVLDDYHLADGPAIAADMAYFLDHLPPTVQLVISTRADPSLPLARLRARGELVEVRAADLRFSLDEVAAYTNQVNGLGLKADEVRALEGRTEGWIAALQLAALSMNGRADVSGFIAGFAGDDRYVVDYLVAEVLNRQPAEVRDFLLQTSILDRLGGPLCDAVTGQHHARSMLELLDRSNLFVVPLDDNRQWYRYHHLFGEVLRTYLAEEQAENLAGLHVRAATWFETAAEPVAAVRHLLAAGEVARAADLVEGSATGFLRDRRESTVRAWIDDIPAGEVARRPVLAIGFIGALMSGGEFAEVEQRLDAVEKLLDPGSERTADLVVLDPAEYERVPGAIAMYRAALALVAGDLTATATHADRAVVRAVPGDHLTVSAAAALSGLASWTSGDLVTAHTKYSAAIDGLRKAGHFSDVLGCSVTLADLRITRGHLTEARRTFEDGLRLATGEGRDGPLRGTADMYVGLSRIAYERNDLTAAREHLDRADELGADLGLPQNPYRSRVARAMLRAAAADLTGALALLDEAAAVYDGDYSPDVRPVAAVRARLLLGQGRLDDVLHWAREVGLTAVDEPSYLREYEYLTLARALVQQRTETVTGLLERLRVAAEDGDRVETTIEVLTLQALAHHAEHGRHDLPGAATLLERALRLGEPEGYLRIFVDQGLALQPILEALLRRFPSWKYPRLVLDAFRPAATPTSRVPSPELVEQLSPRELDVLRLLASDLDGPSIARELVVSLNTVRTHTKNIYAKLGVSSRRAAVSRGTELRLVQRPGTASG